jgi:hypothetical protein
MQMQKFMSEDLLDSSLRQYDTALEPHRLKFEDRLFPLLTETNPKTLLAFWIHFSKEGIGMTEPVEGWIRRAGEKCLAMNYTALGENLRKHAIHEADHHLMMIEDLKNLVLLWNKQYSPKLIAENLLEEPYALAVNQYADLHEHYIQSQEPYCQIAIEYEIENLSATYGLEVLEHSVDVIGEDLKPCLSFLFDHARIDVAHTQFNRKTLSQFFTGHPETTPILIQAGIEALSTYGNFLSHCWDRALE